MPSNRIQFNIRLRNENERDRINDTAAKLGISANDLILKAIDQYLDDTSISASNNDSKGDSSNDSNSDSKGDSKGDSTDTSTNNSTNIRLVVNVVKDAIAPLGAKLAILEANLEELSKAQSVLNDRTSVHNNQTIIAVQKDIEAMKVRIKEVEDLNPLEAAVEDPAIDVTVANEQLAIDEAIDSENLDDDSNIEVKYVDKPPIDFEAIRAQSLDEPPVESKPVEKKKRVRRTKAQMEADRLAEEEAKEAYRKNIEELKAKTEEKERLYQSKEQNT